MWYDDSNPTELAEMLLQDLRRATSEEGRVHACGPGDVKFKRDLVRLVQLLRDRDWQNRTKETRPGQAGLQQAKRVERQLPTGGGQGPE